MSMKRDPRARATGRLGVTHGERYALIKREVMESAAYRALPPSAVLVLLALAVQYYRGRNGSLALPWAEAKSLGVRTQAQLYGGLRLLEATNLIHCTRRARLLGGRKLPNMYALTWWRVDDPAPGIVYDAGNSMTLKPTHDWVRWNRPENWAEYVRNTYRRARGQRNHKCPFGKNPDTQREEMAAHSVRSGDSHLRSQREGREAAFPTHSAGVTSKNLGSGAPPATEDGP